MGYKETAEEKQKRKEKEAKWKADAAVKEAKANYDMFGTTEQNIPQVNPMGDATAPAAAGMKKGGSVSSASKRADGCAIRGKTKA